jgi:hypothetical protein
MTRLPHLTRPTSSRRLCAIATASVVSVLAVALAGCDDGPSDSTGSQTSAASQAERTEDCQSWCNKAATESGCTPLGYPYDNCGRFCQEEGACADAGALLACEAKVTEPSWVCSSIGVGAEFVCGAEFVAWRDAVSACRPDKPPVSSNGSPPVNVGGSQPPTP